MIGQKDDPEVAVLTSTKVALDQRRVHHQEFVYLLEVGMVGLGNVLGE